MADEEVVDSVHSAIDRKVPGNNSFVGSAEYVADLHEAILKQRSDRAEHEVLFSRNRSGQAVPISDGRYLRHRDTHCQPIEQQLVAQELFGVIP
ncbi:hypothetical protein A5685_07765 [Mycobacterium colombiense]|uniref:Uncharacterized protein n=1 Tax=Mycobacterium colombiense TaxID=339268 RepID=A0A1A2RXX1_9MYCO|nr:hypothetical protein A5685_07765 [Mycobacterium colombiense]